VNVKDFFWAEESTRDNMDFLLDKKCTFFFFFALASRSTTRSQHNNNTLLFNHRIARAR